MVLGGFTPSLVNFRGDLLRTMAAAGHDVLASAPEDDAAVRTALSDMGVRFEPVALARAGTNPLADLAYLARLWRLLRRERPDVVLGYTAKPVIFGSLAARAAGVPRRAAMITGIGSALANHSGQGRWLGGLMRWLYRVGLRAADTVFFQNPDDEQQFRNLGLLRSAHRVQRINGSGVNLERFERRPLPSGPPHVVLMVARLLRDKGVREYAEAARLARRSLPGTRFQLVGPLDPNPTSVRAEELASWVRAGDLEYLGATDDVRPFLAAAHLFVLPSYGEGTPRSVLEAMAVGRPVITTDAPGCRETVVPGLNGWLVPARDAPALAAVLVEALRDADLAKMAEASRRLAETRFDVRGVNRVVMETLGIAWPSGGARNAEASDSTRGAT